MINIFARSFMIATRTGSDTPPARPESRKFRWLPGAPIQVRPEPERKSR